MKLVPSDKILLTGAGFTKNFGGFLSSDMSQEIFNSTELDNQERIKSFVRNNPQYDYETIYQMIMDGDEYSSKEKDAIYNAILEAYRNLDDSIRPWIFNFDSLYPICALHLNNLISKFANDCQGYFFTVNQDLFIERKYKGTNKCWPVTVVQWNPLFREGNSDLSLQKDEYCTLPGNEKLDDEEKRNILNSCRFLYIKLHGSYGWLSHDGSHKMVIGKNKLEQLKREPLLNWYYEIFSRILSGKNLKLMVIGYGFGDEHINNVLARSPGLKLFIVSPQKKDNFKRNLFRIPRIGRKLYNMVHRYYEKELVEIFPPDQKVSQTYKQIKRDFFGLNVN